jgi:hypothetical protein
VSGEGIVSGDGIGVGEGLRWGTGVACGVGVPCGVPRLVAPSVPPSEYPFITDQDARATRMHSTAGAMSLNFRPFIPLSSSCAIKRFELVGASQQLVIVA